MNDENEWQKKRGADEGHKYVNIMPLETVI